MVKSCVNGESLTEFSSLWTPECQACINVVKEKLTTAPILDFADFPHL